MYHWYEHFLQLRKEQSGQPVNPLPLHLPLDDQEEPPVNQEPPTKDRGVVIIELNHDVG